MLGQRPLRGATINWRLQQILLFACQDSAQSTSCAAQATGRQWALNSSKQAPQCATYWQLQHCSPAYWGDVVECQIPLRVTVPVGSSIRTQGWHNICMQGPALWHRRQQALYCRGFCVLATCVCAIPKVCPNCHRSAALHQEQGAVHVAGASPRCKSHIIMLHAVLGTVPPLPSPAAAVSIRPAGVPLRLLAFRCACCRFLVPAGVACDCWPFAAPAGVALRSSP